MVYGDGITTRLTTGCVGFYVSKPRQSDTLREELVYCLLGHVSLFMRERGAEMADRTWGCWR